MFNLGEDPGTLTRLLDQIAASAWEGKIPIERLLTSEIFAEYKDLFRKALEDGWRAGGAVIDYTSPDMLRLAVMEANVFRFANAKADILARQMSKLAREASTFPDFRKAVSALGEMYNKRWLETEYNFAQAVGQNGAKYNRHIKEKDVFPYVKYRTIGDERVRDAHRALHDKIFEVGSDAYDLIIPPNGWGCRCELNQITHEDMLERRGSLVDKEQTISLLKETKNGKGSEWDYMVRNNFNTNRAKLGEVFKEKEFYTDLPKREVKKKVEKAAPKPLADTPHPTFKANFGAFFDKQIQTKAITPIPKEFWSVMPKDVTFVKSPTSKWLKRRKGDAWYSPSSKEIVIRRNDRFKSTREYPKDSVVHEGGHAVHYEYNHITDKGINPWLEKRIQDDLWSSLKSDISVENMAKDWIQVKHWEKVSELQKLPKFSQYTRMELSEKLGDFADTIQSLSAANKEEIFVTARKQMFGYGHDYSYQLNRIHSYMEAYAHTFELKYSKNEVFEHFAPNLHKEMKKLGDEILQDIKKQIELRK